MTLPHQCGEEQNRCTVNLRGVFGFAFGVIAAYALSFGLDLLVASAVGYYPAKPYGPGLL